MVNLPACLSRRPQNQTNHGHTDPTVGIHALLHELRQCGGQSPHMHLLLTHFLELECEFTLTGRHGAQVDELTGIGLRLLD